MSRIYIGRKSCGCVVAGCVDMPDDRASTAKWLAEFVRDGLSIEQCETGNAPPLQHCRCDEEPSLFDPDTLGRTE